MDVSAPTIGYCRQAVMEGSQSIFSCGIVPRRGVHLGAYLLFIYQSGQGASGILDIYWDSVGTEEAGMLGATAPHCGFDYSCDCGELIRIPIIVCRDDEEAK